MGDAILPRCAVCNAVSELAEMLEPHSGVHVHRGACWEVWVEARESQRIEWAVSLLRRQ
jgi:hypothetical protein